MRHPAIVLAAVLVFQSAAEADEPGRTPYGALHDSWESEVELLKQDAAETDGKAPPDRLLELRTRYTRRFLELAREHKSDDTWLDCLIWTVTHGVAGPDLDAMIDLARERAPDVDNQLQLRLLMSELINLESDHLNPALRDIAEHHPSAGVRGAALYALAARTKRIAERDGSPEGCRDAEELLRQVMAEYPTVRTYRGENKENAESLLNELQSSTAIGKPALGTRGETLDGDVFDLSAHRGKVVVLAFSGHWCGPCVRMHGIQKKLLESYPPERVTIVEVNSDKADDLASVRETVEQEGLRWTMLIDGRDRAIARDWHVTEWPTFYVLDERHQIRRKASGYVGEQLADWVKQLVDPER